MITAPVMKGLKPTSKNKNQSFGIHFLISNQKMNFKKSFHFSIFVIKFKNEKWKIFKIRFVLNWKNELYFRYTDLVSYLNFVFFIEVKGKSKYRILNFVFQFIKKAKWHFGYTDLTLSSNKLYFYRIKLYKHNRKYCISLKECKINKNK